MRFTRTVLNDGIPLRHRCRHHDIDRRTDGNGIKENMAATQMICLRHNESVSDIYFGSECTEAFDVEVDRPAADVASARKRHLRLFIFAKQCTNQIIGSTDPLDIVVIYAYLSDILTVHHNRMSCNPLCPDANAFHRLKEYVDISNVRQIFNQYRIIRHYCSCQNTERRIFRTADLDFACQRIAASDNILFHRTPLSFLYTPP